MRLLSLPLIVLILSITTKSYAQDTGFSESLRHAYLYHPALEASRSEWKALAEEYPQALSGWRPQISAEASVYATDIDTSNFTGGSGATTKDFFLNLEQPLFRGGRTVAETRGAKNLVRAGWESARDLEQNILLQATQAYMNVRRSHQVLNLRLHNENLVRKELDGVNARYQGGELTVTDVYQARSRLAAVQALKLQAQAQYDDSRTVFERVFGFYPSGTLLSPDLYVPMPENLDKGLAMAAQNNPRLLAAEFRMAAARDFKDASFRELYPNLFAFASFNKQYDPQPGIIEDTQVETIGLRLTVPLYSGGVTRSRIREARHTVMQRKMEHADLRRMVKNNFIESWRRQLSADADLHLREIQVKAADAAREGVSQSALMGERTVLDVLDAEQDFIEAEAARINSAYKSQYARYEVLATLGGLTPAFIGITPEMPQADDYMNKIGKLYFATKAE